VLHFPGRKEARASRRLIQNLGMQQQSIAISDVHLHEANWTPEMHEAPRRAF
jgi:hypothetical protein